MIIMVGIPGAGKTWIVQALFGPHLKISRDQLPNKSRNDMDKLLIHATKLRRHIVVDAANETISKRRRFIRFARENGYRIYALVADTSMDLAMARMEHRGRKVPKGALEGYANGLQWPTKKEGFDEVLVTWDDWDPRGQ